MSTLVERLRVRLESRPHYSLDDSDDEADLLLGKSKKAEQFEKIIRDDAKEDSCNACGESGNLLICETCTYEYHPKCLLPPLKAPLPTSWRCPNCVNPLNDIEKILDCEMRPTVADDSDASKLGSKQIFLKQYLVKWKGLSYLHCTWVPEKEFIKAYKELPRLRTKVNNFRKQMSVGNNSEDDYVPIRPEYTMVDRILACRQDDEEKEYLVKWVGLNYEECYWESELDISSFQQQIENFNRLQSRYQKLRKQKSNNRDATDSKKKPKEFQQFEKSPEFLPGGDLHPYQLEGLNFLRFSWSKQIHVILADEMGLGKTIQSIAFLASLYEENVSPHLVVAPLSTLRNWEREFTTWAPHMNVVMYVGTAAARAVIRAYEFYFPKIHKKDKKKKSSHGISESKQERIKFDVLLTSYEMIDIDNGSLKAIKWETMIVDEGHRLKNKDSKLFSSLKQFNTRHRTLLTGTPLQNNLDELFMLMHFLDAGKFASLEEFQEEFKDINQEEQVSRLHKMLAPHLLSMNLWSARPALTENEKTAVRVLCQVKAKILSLQNDRSRDNLISAHLVPSNKGEVTHILSGIIEEEVLNPQPIDQAAPIEPEMVRQARVSRPPSKKKMVQVELEQEATPLVKRPSGSRPTIPQQRESSPDVVMVPSLQRKGKEVVGKRPGPISEKEGGTKKKKVGSKLDPDFETLLDSLGESAGEVLSEVRQKTTCALKGDRLRKEALASMVNAVTLNFKLFLEHGVQEEELKQSSREAVGTLTEERDVLKASLNLLKGELKKKDSQLWAQEEELLKLRSEHKKATAEVAKSQVEYSKIFAANEGLLLELDKAHRESGESLTGKNQVISDLEAQLVQKNAEIAKIVADADEDVTNVALHLLTRFPDLDLSFEEGLAIAANRARALIAAEADGELGEFSAAARGAGQAIADSVIVSSGRDRTTEPVLTKAAPHDEPPVATEAGLTSGPVRHLVDEPTDDELGPF